ncbi:MAG TPA: hypothetical protein VHG28_21370 [Longimicrobiaceae bacterium]|nr:hypothetical protein [Longimicrobiaceae bacterium]
MSNAQAERPRFYQGQYLGPEDLSAAVDHSRWARARHDLGAHAWGIAAGLELREVEALEGGVEVYVEPGYAVDGFGRPLVVTSALPVPADALARLSLALGAGETSVAVPVWLRYAETATSQPPYGFATCESDDAFARVGEGVEVLVGARTLADQRDPVVIDGVETDPVEALRTIEDEAPLLCDASVPFQTFPEDDDRWWLIPLGYVRWEPGSEQVIETTEADRRETRRFRRYLGVVAEGVYAADGLIRLRGRTVVPEDGAVSTEDACESEWPRAQSEIDLAYDDETGRVTPEELVWVEGNLRVAGDTRLFGGDLEFRDEDGDTGGVPMRVCRVEANSFLDTGGTAVSGKDLEVRIGTLGEDGRNRLVIGTHVSDPGEVGGKVVVQNDGRVGIGTLADPPTPLLSPLTVRGIGDGEELLSFEASDGTRSWHLNLKPGGADGLNFAETDVADGRLFLAAGGNVGLSTTEPGAKLDVREVSTAAGAKWLRVGDGGDSGRFWVEYSADLAPRLVLSDRDDPPRIRFQQTGPGLDEAVPDHWSWIGHARAQSPDLAVMNGRLGVGTTDPQALLHVEGGSDVALADAASGYLLIGAVNGQNVVMDPNEIMARNNGAVSVLHLQAEGGDLVVHRNVDVARRVAVKDSGRVGIGTESPAEQLDVRGNVKLGASGELFAVGGVDNLRLVAGRVDTAGTEVTGSGYTATWTGTGVCVVTFTSAFAATPVVVATPVSGSGDDQLVTLTAIAAGSFTVVTADVEHTSGDQDVGTRESTEFTFIALGAR